MHSRIGEFWGQANHQNLSLFCFYLLVQEHVPARFKEFLFGVRSNGREAISGTEAHKQRFPMFLLRSCCNQTPIIALLSISEKALILYELLFSLNSFRLQTCICLQILNQLQGQTPAEDLWKSWNHLYVFLYPVNLVQLRNNLAVDRYLLKAAVLADEPSGWCWQAWIFCTSSHLFPLIEAHMSDYFACRLFAC